LAFRSDCLPLLDGGSILFADLGGILDPRHHFFGCCGCVCSWCSCNEDYFP
jgi:hypothetical protein